MSLNSFSFLCLFFFISALMLILQLLRKKASIIVQIQLFLLLLFGYVLIFLSDWRFCVCIVFITILSFVFGLWLEKKRNKVILFLGSSILILFLGYFKYAGFFINSFRRVLGFDTVSVSIILPLGISFYTFSALAYLIDVFRNDYPAERNLLHFALFISFFPKLTAGPIVRGKTFFPQVKEYRGIEWEAFKAGIQIFVFGLFKKMVLADHLGVFVDDVFHSPTAFNTGTVILATFSYSLQIYYDFSGYSDMAIGISKIWGFDFEKNFNLPYVAQNVSEFWKRWHISLSTWFQDYLYIPLGGNRKGKARTYLNLILVMIISGLWHGSGWTFIIWGLFHGIASCVSKAFGNKMKKLGPYANGVITFIFVTLCWVVFRANSFSKACEVWKGMFTLHTGINQPYTWSFFAIICLISSTIVAKIKRNKSGSNSDSGSIVVNGFYPVLDLSKFWSLVVFFTFCGLTIIMGYYGNTAFIYGAF